MKSIEGLETLSGFASLGAASEQQIVDAENALGLRFASDYREYLSRFGIASFSGHEFTGVGASKRLSVVNVTLRNRPLVNGTSGLYVVEEANIDGLVFWQAPDGKVFRTIMDSSPEEIGRSLLDLV